MKSFLINTVFVLLVTVPIYAQSPSSSAGTASNLMLRFGTSAKVTGLSEAFTGLADDENSLLYNPGGLPNIQKGIFSLNHAEWFEDIRIDNMVFGYNLFNDLGIGFSISHMWMPEIQGKDEYGQETAPFNVSSSIVNLGVGYKVHPGFFTGIGIKYFVDNLANYSASGVALDVGLYMRTIIPGLTAGLALQNFGGDIQYDKEKQRIPLTYRGGLAYKLYSQHLTFTTDVVKSIDSELNINTGIEYIFKDFVSLRIGNRFSENEMFLPAFGAGIQLEDMFHINYTFFNLSDLGSTHRVGISYHFNIPYNLKWRKGLVKKPQLVLLVPPKKVNVSLIHEELVITWDKVEGAKYNVYAKYGDKSDWKKITNETLIINFLKINKKPEPGNYSFKITSVINNRESNFSEEVTIHVE